MNTEKKSLGQGSALEAIEDGRMLGRLLRADQPTLEQRIDALEKRVAQLEATPERHLRGLNLAQLKIDLIKRTVVSIYGITLEQLNSRRRTQVIVFPRQLAIWAAVHVAGFNYSETGRLFSLDHGTVMHAIRAIKARSETEPAFSIKLVNLETAVKSILADKIPGAIMP